MMVWKVAEINYDIFKDFFGKENLAGKTIYFIEGEIELPKHKITDFINEIKVGTKRQRMGANRNLRVSYESVFLFKK